jgi:hypothetical protein
MRFRLREINDELKGGVIVKANLTLCAIRSNRFEHCTLDDPFITLFFRAFGLPKFEAKILTLCGKSEPIMLGV